MVNPYLDLGRLRDRCQMSFVRFLSDDHKDSEQNKGNKIRHTDLSKLTYLFTGAY